MADELKPSPDSSDKSANNQPDKENTQTPKIQIEPAERNDAAKESWLDVIVVALEFFALVFWMVSEEFHHWISHSIFLSIAASFFLAGGAHVLNKKLKRPFVVWSGFGLLCVIFSLAVFSNARPVPAQLVGIMSPTISPSRAKLSDGYLEIFTPVIISNPNDVPIYSVRVKFELEGDKVSEKSIEFKPDDQKSLLTVKSAGFSLHSGMGISCIVESREKTNFVSIWLFDMIPAKSFRQITVNGKPLERSFANISILDFKKNPGEILRFTNHVEALVESIGKKDERVKVLGMTLKVNKNEDIGDTARNQRHFRIAVNTTSDPKNLVMLTNDFLYSSDWHTNIQVRGAVGIPIQAAELKNLNFTIHPLDLAEGVQVICLFPKEWKCAMYPEWKEGTARINQHGLQMWVFPVPIPLHPGIGVEIPPIAINLGKSITGNVFGFIVQSKNWPDEALFFDMAFLSVPPQFDQKPSVKRYQRGKDGKNIIPFHFDELKK